MEKGITFQNLSERCNNIHANISKNHLYYVIVKETIMTKLITKLFLIASVITLSSCNMIENTSSKTKQPSVKEIIDNNISENDIVINMAVLYYDNYTLEKKLVKKFNEANNGYHINVIDYADFYDIDPNETQNFGEAYAAADMQIIQDIINKNNIDMILNLLTGERLISLAQKGAFVDLNKFMENDQDINRQILNDHVLELCEMDSGLYYMPLGYGINTLYGYEKYVGQIDDWNISTMKLHWQQMPENSIFSKQHMGGADTASGIFYDICMNCISSFINYENNKCKFDSEEFIELLDFTSVFEKEAIGDKENFISGNYFLSTAKIESFEKFQEYLFDYGSNEKISFVGYPSIDGNNSFISMHGDVEICAKSSKEVQQGAWEFIKALTSEEVQNEMFFTDIMQDDNFNEIDFDLGFPINNNVLKKKANELISKKDEGRIIFMNGTSYNIGNLTNEEFMLLEDIINNTTFVEIGFSDLYSIIYEEVGMMIEGNQTSSQTAKNIQNRASILLNE